MAKVDVKCPFCEQTESVKKHGLGKAGHQRNRACHLGMKEQIVDLAMNNSGIRDTARALHISINAVVRTLKTLATMCNYAATGQPANPAHLRS